MFNFKEGVIDGNNLDVRAFYGNAEDRGSNPTEAIDRNMTGAILDYALLSVAVEITKQFW